MHIRRLEKEGFLHEKGPFTADRGADALCGCRLRGNARTADGGNADSRNADADPDAYSYADPDAYSHAHADADPDAYSYSYTYTYAYSYTYAHADAYSYTYSYADPHADPDACRLARDRSEDHRQIL